MMQVTPAAAGNPLHHADARRGDGQLIGRLGIATNPDNPDEICAPRGEHPSQWSCKRALLEGRGWVGVNDEVHEFEPVASITGDMRKPGDVYISQPAMTESWRESRAIEPCCVPAICIFPRELRLQAPRPPRWASPVIGTDGGPGELLLANRQIP